MMSGFIKLFDQEIGDDELYHEVKNTFGHENFDLEVLMTVFEDLSNSKQEFFRTVSPQTTGFLFRIEKENESLRLELEVIKVQVEKLTNMIVLNNN